MMASPTSATDPYKDRPAKDRYLSLDDERYFQEVFEAQAARTYLYLSVGIGLIAALLPFLLVWRGGYRAHNSISSFYTIDVGSSRDVLVGMLCAVGVFLFLFHGLSKKENWLLNAAGISVIGVALIPMPTSELLHRGLAIVFFLLIGIVAILYSKGRLDRIKTDRAKRSFKTAYTLAGSAMIVLPLSIVVLQFTPFRFDHYMFWIEFFAILAFSVYWFTKTLEYYLLLGISWMAPDDPKLASRTKG